MGRRLRITIASILALAIAGCSGEEEQAETVAPTPNQTAKNSQGKPENFKDPVVPGTPSATVAKAPSTLIQPTNPTERVGVVSKGRSDPFDDIIPPVKFATKKPEGTVVNKPKKAVPVLPPLPSSSRSTLSRRRRPRSAVISATTGGSSRNIVRNSSSGRAIPKNRRTTVTNQKNRRTTVTKPNSNLNPSRATSVPVVPASVPVVPKVLPGVIPQPDLASVLPPPPQPKLAQAVLVSGVVQVGNRPQAIIKVPSEPTSRYVQPGQRLASGLLVKRIEMNEGSEPVVILEQHGIEVARMVGEAPMGGSEPATASTENSVS
ncbi:MAG: hypothetical protein AAFS12_17085, partial [Cyanobacteria bacterium J06632_19]